jgi:hypothetical protein
MQETDEAGQPAPNVLLMLAMAVGTWGLVYLGVASLWPRQGPTLAVESVHALQLASLTDRPQVKSPTRTGVKAKRTRRIGPSLAQRVFRPSTSLN